MTAVAENVETFLAPGIQLVLSMRNEKAVENTSRRHCLRKCHVTPEDTIFVIFVGHREIRLDL